MDEMLRRERFTAEQLASIGLNENQLLARQRMLSMFDDVLQKMNEARLEHGLDPVTPQEAYLSSRWRGAFRQGIRDSEGRLKWYLASETKKGLDSQVQALLKEFPDLVVDKKLEHTSRRGRVRSEPSELYHTMLDVLGRNDPKVQEIKQWYEMQQTLDAESAYAQAKHFEKKGNIRGFVGDRPGKAGTKQEALALFQEQIAYAKNGYNWSALNRAGQKLKQIFQNEELQAQQPKNMQYLREYYMDQLGLNTAQWVQALEDSVKSLGITVDKVNDVVNAGKSAWILQKLAGSVGYGLSQVLQAANMMPHLTNIMIRDRVNPMAVPASMLQGFAEGMLMATGHVVGQSDTLISSAKFRPGESVFSAKAMKYAEDNSIITRSLADESPIESSFSKVAGGIKVANKTISVPEAYLRSTVYMTYVHMLKFANKHVNDLALFREAEELTNASMGDYRAGERAMIFSKMGSIGNIANILQTYPINFYNQYSWAAREASRKNPVPLFAMLGTHYAIAGLMGIPGFQDIDKLWNWTKDKLASHSPDMWNKVKDWDLKQLALNSPMGESGLYGLASVNSGISLTSRAAAPAGSEMLVNPAAPYVDFGEQALSVGKAVAQPDQQTAAQAALNVAPVGLQGMLETGLLRDQTSVQRPDGRLYGKTRDLASREGMIVRSPEEEKLRAFGLKSQRETLERDQAYYLSSKNAQAKKVAAVLPDKAWNAIRKGDKEKAAEYIKLYVELTGKPMTTDMFQQRAIDEYTTAAEKAQIKSKTLPGLQALKQMKELLNASK
jgi:hypothetical protein